MNEELFWKKNNVHTHTPAFSQQDFHAHPQAAHHASACTCKTQFSQAIPPFSMLLSPDWMVESK